MIVDFETLKIPLRDPQKTPLFFVATQFAQNVHKMCSLQLPKHLFLTCFWPYFGGGRRDPQDRYTRHFDPSGTLGEGGQNLGCQKHVFLKFSLRARSLLTHIFRGDFGVFLGFWGSKLRVERCWGYRRELRSKHAYFHFSMLGGSSSKKIYIDFQTCKSGHFDVFLRCTHFATSSPGAKTNCAHFVHMCK